MSRSRRCGLRPLDHVARVRGDARADGDGEEAVGGEGCGRRESAVRPDS